VARLGAHGGRPGRAELAGTAGTAAAAQLGVGSSVAGQQLGLEAEGRDGREQLRRRGAAAHARALRVEVDLRVIDAAHVAERALDAPGAVLAVHACPHHAPNGHPAGRRGRSTEIGVREAKK
jgi:hypothetical protein